MTDKTIEVQPVKENVIQEQPIKEETVQLATPKEKQVEVKDEQKVAENVIKVKEPARVEQTLDLTANEKDIDADIRSKFGLSEPEFGECKHASKIISDILIQANPKGKEELQATLLSAISEFQNKLNKGKDENQNKALEEFRNESLVQFGTNYADIMSKINEQLKYEHGLEIEDLRKVYGAKETVKRCYQMYHAPGTKYRTPIHKANNNESVLSQMKEYSKKHGGLFGFTVDKV